MPKTDPIGKKELLKWISSASGKQCSKLDDLKDGVVFLKMFSKIWPKVVNLRKVKWKPNPRTDWESKQNWNAIRAAMIELKLPLQVYDRAGITSGRFKPCYSFLVMLYFLYHLSQNHDFSVDFAHPIDSKLAAFLQSAESIRCLLKGGGLDLKSIPSSIAEELSLPNNYDEASDHSSNSQDYEHNQHGEDSTLGWSRSQQGSFFEYLQEETPQQHSEAKDKELTLQDLDDVQQEPQKQNSKPVKSNSKNLKEENYSPQEIRNSLGSDSTDKKPKQPEGLISKIESQGNQVSMGSQTELDFRRVEKVMIRNLKGKREIDDLKRMLEDAYTRIDEMETKLESHSKDNSEISNQSKDSSNNSSNFIWKNKQNKQKGELILSKMRFEIESLHRQLEYAKEEKEYAVKKLEHEINDLKNSHEQEMLYQRDSYNNQATTQQLLLFNERMRDQRDYTLELKKIKDEISFEIDRLRQGGLQFEDDDALEEEILRLRQLRVAQSKELKALEESNSNLTTLVEQLQEKVKEDQEKNSSLHKYYSRKHNEELEELQLDFEQDDYENLSDGAKFQREQMLVKKLKESKQETDQMKLEHNQEVENLKTELAKNQQQQGQFINTSTIDEDFDKDQTIERLRSEIDRLKRANDYLRERSVVFDNMNNDSRRIQSSLNNSNDDNEQNQEQWVPETQVEDHIEVEALFESSVLGLIKEFDEQLKPSYYDATAQQDERQSLSTVAERIRKGFWTLTTHKKILQQRIERAASVIQNLRSNVNESKAQMAKELAQKDTKINESSRAQEEEMRSITKDIDKERARYRVKIKLLEESINHMKTELMEATQQSQEVFEMIAGADENRFKELKSKYMRACNDLNACYQREAIWHKLIQCQRASIDALERLQQCENYDDAMELNQRRSEFDKEAASYLHELEALTAEHSASFEFKPLQDDNLSSLVEEAVKSLKEQNRQYAKKLENVIDEHAKERNELIKDTSESREMQTELEYEKKTAASLRAQVGSLLKEREHLQKQVFEGKELESETVARLRKELEKLSDKLEESKIKEKEQEHFNPTETSAMNSSSTQQDSHVNYREQGKEDTVQEQGVNQPEKEQHQNENNQDSFLKENYTSDENHSNTKEKQNKEYVESNSENDKENKQDEEKIEKEGIENHEQEAMESKEKEDEEKDEEKEEKDEAKEVNEENFESMETN
eukprot:gb/GECH01012576.1/.p1 GENE.gb/GECH01012576.1/~~gb/GECH01012576.1/.p1  ORF type:complete len:1192 (+),score=381.65 gb/GECH01012576.1/:1-3576(+)